MSSAPENPTALRVRQLEMFYGQLFLELLTGIAAAGVAACVLWNAVDNAKLLSWLAAVLLIYAGRFVTGQRFKASASKNEASSRWLALFVVGAMMAGIVWALAGIAAVSQDSLYRLGLVLFGTSCLCVVTLAIYSGALGVSLAFSVPALVPTTLYLLAQGGQINTVIAVMLLLFLAVLTLSAVKLHKTFLAALTLRDESNRLLDHLDARKLQIDKFSVAVRSQAYKRQQAELALRRVSADLGLAEAQVKTLAATLEHESLTCPVTGLPNRRHFEDTISIEWRRFLRDKKPLSLMMLDFDDIDENKDPLGSESGKARLKRVADVVKRFAARGGDLAVRYDESRFCLLLVGAATTNAAHIAENLRQRVEAEKINRDAQNPQALVTVHIGVATMVPSRSTNPQSLIDRVDKALYEARFQGGNKVACYRALDRLKLERWNVNGDGPVTEDALRRKLKLEGFNATRHEYPPKVKIADRSPEVETVNAVLNGQLLVTVEGQSLVLKPGDCLYLPAGATCSAEVASKDPVVLFDGVKAD